MECPKCTLVIGGSFEKCPRCGASLSHNGGTDSKDIRSEDMTVAFHGFSASAGGGYEKPSTGHGQTGFSGDLSSRYTIEKELDRGGAGVVSLAWDNKLKRKVAIKRIKHQAFGSSGVSRDQAERSFLGEGAALVNVQHPNIVYVYDVGEDSEGLYIVMEYVGGGTLKDKVLKDGVMNAEELARIGVQLCDALSAIHEKEIVHRDIKPGNILLTKRGTPKLVDFGLVLNIATETATQRGVLMGTANFMSPEQKTDSNQVNFLSDIYSLGATLYFAATGKAPHAPNPNDLPAPVREAIMKSIEENPSNRFGDAQEFLKALDGVIKVSNQGSDTYPCYLCGGRVRFSALFCSKCGKDMLEARKEKESLYRTGEKRIREAVDRGEFEGALKELDRLDKKLDHEHFAHMRSEIATRAKEIEDQWQKAKEKKQNLEILLKKAKAAVEQLDLESASKTANEIRSNSDPYFKTVVEEAQKVLNEIEAVRSRRSKLDKLIESAEKKVKDLSLSGEFDQARQELMDLNKPLSEKDFRIHETLREWLKNKLDWIQAEESKAKALKDRMIILLEDAHAAFKQLNLDKAKQIVIDIEKHRQEYREYLKPVLQDCEKIKKEIRGVEETRQAFERDIIKAGELAKDHEYAEAFKALGKIISTTDEAYQLQRKTAFDAEKAYEEDEAKYRETLRIEELRKKFSEQISEANANRKEAKRILKEVLETQERELQDEKAEAVGILARNRRRRMLKVASVIILFVSTGMILTYLPQLQTLRDVAYVSSKKIKIGDRSLYAHVQYMKEKIRNLYPYGKDFEVYHMDTPFGTATIRSNAYLYRDSSLIEEHSEMNLPLYVEVFGFVRTSTGSLRALQIVFSGEREPSYMSVDDITGFMQTNENGAYLKTLINSSVFNKSGQAGPNETRKSIDMFLSSYPQSQFYSHAILDYVECLDWLFRHDNSGKKDAIITLTELYVQKARQHSPGSLQTQRCEQILLDLKKSGT